MGPSASRRDTHDGRVPGAVRKGVARDTHTAHTAQRRPQARLTAGTKSRVYFTSSGGSLERRETIGRSELEVVWPLHRSHERDHQRRVFGTP
jgi:hypothetical protein